MTTRKGFKRIVRARMAKTGESYAAARRSLLAGENTGSAPTATRILGVHPETASLASALRRLGVTGPDGQSLSEALVLVVGGGLGAGYILWEFKARSSAVLALGFRNQWQYPGIPGWFGKTLDRLGVAATLHETAGVVGARRVLDGLLERGIPAVAWVDTQTIGTWHQPEALSGIWGYPVVVTGRRRDGAFLIDDRCAEPLVVAPDVMAAARARISSYRNRIVELRVDPGPIAADRLRSALETGLVDQVEHLRSDSDSFSLPAWRKWARLMTDRRNAKAWPRVFVDGRGLFGTLISIVEAIDSGVGAAGGHLRDRYADGLDEAAGILDRPQLHEAAAAWRVSADRWEVLADAAVPTEVPDAAEAVELAEELHDAVMAGEPGRAAAADAGRRLFELRDRHEAAFPAPPDSVDRLFTDLGERVAAVYEAEVAARDATARAIGR